MKKATLKLIYNSLTIFILLAIIYLSLTSKPVRLNDIHNIDKFQHALAYGVFSLFCCLSIKSWGFVKTKVLLTLLICAILGGGLELIQAKYGRTADSLDFIFDMVGALAGSSLVVFFGTFTKKYN